MKHVFACPHCSGPIMLSTVVTPIAPPNPTHDLPQQALEMAAALLAGVNMPQPHQPPPDQPLAEPSASAKLPQTQLPRRSPKGGAAAASASAMKQTPKAKERPMLAQPVRPFPTAPTMPAGFVPRRVPVPDPGQASKSLDDPWGLRPDHAGGPRPAQPIGAAPPSQPASAAAPAALGVWAAPAEQAAPPRRSPRVDPLQRPAESWLPTPQELLDAEAEMHQRREALAARQAQEPSSADASVAATAAAWPQRQPRPEQDDRSRSPAPLRSRSSGILDSAWTQILHAVVKKELHQD